MTDKTNPGGLRANLILALVTLLICFAVIEGFLRIGHLLTRGPGEDKLYEYDAALGWKTKPNLNTTVPGEGRKIPFTTNAKGLRGPEVAYQRTPGVPRILILGKSFAQAVQVRYEELFSEKLKALLRQRSGKEWDVINAGTAGYCTDQQLIFMQNEGVNYAPDLTMLMFHDNDVWYNNQDYFFEKAKPRFEWTGRALRAVNVPVPTTPLSKNQTNVRAKGFFESAKAWLARNSYFYLLIRKKIRENPVLFEAAARLGISGKNVADVPDDFRVWKRKRDADIHEAWRITESLLLEIRNTAQRAGSQFVVFYVPNRTAIAQEHWTATRVRYGWAEDEWNSHQVAEDLGRLCERHGIPFIDPTENFIRADKEASRREPLYYAIDSHWTPKGHEVTAKTIADWLREHPVSKEAA